MESRDWNRTSSSSSFASAAPRKGATSGMTDSHHFGPRGLSIRPAYEAPATWMAASIAPAWAHCPAPGAAASLPGRKLTSAAGLPFNSPKRPPA
ncbi:hypothetical protein D3C83_10890 [compost metagenome]